MLTLAAFVLPLLVISADITPQEKYIRNYAQLAVEEMYRSGIPASITLAQGLLESRYGLSELASKGHNHFGIKCHNDWKGDTMKVDDDKKGECFRVYEEDIDSFRDHSDFLRYRDRYKFLFDYQITDYKSWAYGLSKAGYATDPAYPAKLIKLIEDYDLSRFDTASPADFEGEILLPDEPVATNQPSGSVDQGKDKEQNKGSKPVKGSKLSKDKRHGKGRHQHKYEVPASIPESPTVLEEVQKVSKKEVDEVFRFPVGRPVYKQNGVPFIYSMEGETYASIADEHDIMRCQLLRYNDLDAASPLLPGTMVYLQAKKKQAARGIDKYIVETDGESLRDICQRFGVRLKSVNKMNGFAPGHNLREGDTILLR